MNSRVMQIYYYRLYTKPIVTLTDGSFCYSPDWAHDTLKVLIAQHQPKLSLIQRLLKVIGY